MAAGQGERGKRTTTKSQVRSSHQEIIYPRFHLQAHPKAVTGASLPLFIETPPLARGKAKYISKVRGKGLLPKMKVDRGWEGKPAKKPRWKAGEILAWGLGGGGDQLDRTQLHVQEVLAGFRCLETSSSLQGEGGRFSSASAVPDSSVQRQERENIAER